MHVGFINLYLGEEVQVVLWCSWVSHRKGQSVALLVSFSSPKPLILLSMFLSGMELIMWIFTTIADTKIGPMQLLCLRSFRILHGDLHIKENQWCSLRVAAETKSNSRATGDCCSGPDSQTRRMNLFLLIQLLFISHWSGWYPHDRGYSPLLSKLI